MHASRRHHDTSLGVSSRRIPDRVGERVEVGRPAVLLILVPLTATRRVESSTKAPMETIAIGLCVGRPSVPGHSSRATLPAGVIASSTSR